MSARTRVGIAVSVVVLAAVIGFLLFRQTRPAPAATPAVPSAVVKSASASTPLTQEQSVKPGTPVAEERRAQPASSPAHGEGKFWGKVLPAEGAQPAPVTLQLHRIDPDAPLTSYADTLFASFVTEISGEYSFDALPLGNYVLYASAGEYTGWASARFSRGYIQQNVEFRLYPGGSISGRVLDPEGEPVAGANVFVAASDAEGQRSFLSRARALSSRQVTGKSGEFTLRDLRRAMSNERGYRIGVKAEGFATLISDYIKLGPDTVELTLTRGAIVNGTLVHADSGEPLPDAAISLESLLPFEEITAKSDAAGFFFIPNINPGLQTARLENSEFIVTPETARFDVPKGAPSAEVTLRVARGATITGRVFDSDTGAGMGGLTVIASVNRDATGKERKTSTGADGAYKISGLPPVPHMIRIEQPKGFGFLRGSEAYPSVMPAVGQEIRGVDFAISRGLSISGIVVDDTGAPIQDAIVNVNSDNGATTAPDRSDAQGAFSISGLWRDTPYNLYASATGFAGWAMKPDLRKSTPLIESISGVTITLIPESVVSGTVVDANGAPAKNQIMTARTTDKPPKYVSTEASGPDGNIEFKQMPPGEYQFRFHDDVSGMSGSDAIVKQVKVARGAKLTGLRFVLPKGGGLTIAGRIIDSRGKPIAGARASVSGVIQRSAQSDDSGNFVISGLKGGKYELDAGARGFAPGKRMTVEAGAAGIEVKLPDYRSVEGQVLNLRTGLPVVAFQLEYGRSIPVRDAEGKFKLDEVIDEISTLRVLAEGFAPAVAAVPPGSPGVPSAPLIVRLEEGLDLTGKVSDRNGQPIGGAYLYVSKSSGWYSESRATSIADGSYRLASLASGTVKVTAVKKGYAPASREVSLSLGGPNQADLTMPSGGSMDVTVTKAGQPAPDADVSTSVANFGSEDLKTNAQGQIHVENLAAGLAKVTAWVNSPAGSQQRVVQAQVVEGQTSQVQIDFSGGNVVLEGTVFETPGVPLQTQRYLSASWNSGVNNSSTRTDASGHYRFEGLPEGEVSLRIDTLNRLTKVMNVHLSEGAPVHKDIVLSAGTTLGIDVAGRSNAVGMNTQVIVLAGEIPFDGDVRSLSRSNRQAQVYFASLQAEHIEFQGLEPGTYTIIVYEENSVLAQQGKNPYGRWGSTLVTIGGEAEKRVGLSL